MTRFVCAAARRTDGVPVFRRPCRRRHVDLPRLSVRQGQRRAEDQSRPGMARPGALRHRAPRRAAPASFVSERGPDPHQPSLRRSPASPSSRRRTRASSKTASSRRPAKRKALPDAGRRRAHRHGRHHREGLRGHRRQGRDRRQRGAQVHADAARGRVREAGHAEVPERHAVRRRPVLALQVQALHRRAHGVRARGRHRRVRRRP